jgi:hypothetical protein
MALLYQSLKRQIFVSLLALQAGGGVLLENGNGIIVE